MTKPFALIIEDEPQLGKIFTLALDHDFVTEIVSDGHSALARLAQTTPELIILDLHLPGVSGRELLTHIRADERLAKVRVILATADARQADDLSQEADLVLLKPVSPVQLRDLAHRLRQPG